MEASLKQKAATDKLKQDCLKEEAVRKHLESLRLESNANEWDMDQDLFDKI